MDSKSSFSSGMQNRSRASSRSRTQTDSAQLSGDAHGTESSSERFEALLGGLCENFDLE